MRKLSTLGLAFSAVLGFSLCAHAESPTRLCQYVIGANGQQSCVDVGPGGTTNGLTTVPLFVQMSSSPSAPNYTKITDGTNNAGVSNGSPATVASPNGLYTDSFNYVFDPSSGNWRPVATGLSYMAAGNNLFGSAAFGQYSGGILLTTGQFAPLQVDTNGRLIVSPSSFANPPVGAANLATNQVSVGATATLISAARIGAPGTGRVALTVVNTSTAPVYLGGSGVTTTTGTLLPGILGASVTINTQAAVYGITASGSETVSEFETY